MDQTAELHHAAETKWNYRIRDFATSYNQVCVAFPGSSLFNDDTQLNVVEIREHYCHGDNHIGLSERKVLS